MDILAVAWLLVDAIRTVSQTPAAVGTSILLGTIGFSALASGVSKPELVLDVPALAVFGAGTIHGLSLWETARLLAVTVVEAWTALLGAPDPWTVVAVVAVWAAVGIAYKIQYVTADIGRVLLPS